MNPWLGGGAIAGLAIAVAVMAWRMVGMARDRAAAREEAGAERESRGASDLALEAEKIGRAKDVEEAKRLAGELADTRERYEARLTELRANVAELEEDLDACSTPGARAARLEQLLSIAAPGGAGTPP